MSHLALTQVALNKFARMPGGAADLRQKRRDAMALKSQAQRDHDKRMSELDGLIHRIGVALGEVSA